MYFNRMAAYYERQSSGRYSVDGDVTEWVKVPFNQALYGRGYCGNPAGAPVTSCASTKALVRDALAVWVQDQLDAGQTMTQIQDYLKTFDVQDRYDSRRRRQLRGAGRLHRPLPDRARGWRRGGGRPDYGTDAIWSHRSYSNLQAGGPGGLPGVNVGSNDGSLSSDKVPDNPTGVWVGDYTIQPENGGLGVFAHEFGHDLGLPDLYDTSGNTGGAENNTAFWSLMSSGANIGDGGPDGIGDAPTDMGVWELFQLGWLNEQGDQGPFYDVAYAGRAVVAHALHERPGDRQRRAGALHGAAGPRGAAAARCPEDRRVHVLVDAGQRPQHLDDEDGRGGQQPHRPGQLRHRDRLGLRVPRGVRRRRHDVGAGGDQPLRHRG